MTLDTRTDSPSPTTSDSIWRERFNATLGAAVDAVVVIDEKGTIERVNPATEKMYGYSAEELIGSNVSKLMPEPDASRHGQYLDRYLQTGEARIVGIGREVQGRRKDGSVFPVSLAVGEGTLEGKRFFVGLMRDLTEQKQLEARLLQREEELRSIHDNALVATASLDLDGCFRIVNAACCKLYGGDRSELLGRRFLDIVHPEDRSEVESLLQRLVTGEDGAAQQNHRCLGRDGSVHYGSLHLSVIHGEGGRPQRLVVQMVDRTEQVKAERAALETQERLAHVNRLSTLGEMAGGIAHEVNQPLGAISNYAQAGRVLLASGRGEDKVDDVLEKISQQAVRAGDVIRRLRSLAKRQEHGRDFADVNGVIREILGLAVLDARLQSVRIELDLTPELPPVLMDEIQIQQVVLNLMRNGMESMMEAGVESPVLTVSSELCDDGVCLAVSDLGSGVPEQLRNEILNPFFSSKETGMGLGLSICQSIVSAHGGRLDFENREGGGATFFFTLPVEEEGGSEGGGADE